MRRLVNPPKHLWRPFLCAITFQNSSALPLVIVQSLSGFPPFDRVEYPVAWTFTWSVVLRERCERQKMCGVRHLGTS